MNENEQRIGVQDSNQNQQGENMKRIFLIIAIGIASSVALAESDRDYDSVKDWLSFQDKQLKNSLDDQLNICGRAAVTTAASFVIDQSADLPESLWIDSLALPLKSGFAEVGIQSFIVHVDLRRDDEGRCYGSHPYFEQK